MLTSELYWRNWNPDNTWESIVATLRWVREGRIRTDILAHVVRERSDIFTVLFSDKPCFAGVESPVFTTMEDAKAYASMTCLLVLGEDANAYQ
jgi:hypothetical protein